jgi:hypothetical protein
LASTSRRTFHGHTFLVVDGNGAAGYTADADDVIDITNFSGDPSLIHFV